MILTSADVSVIPERRMHFIQPSLHTRTAIGKDMQWRWNLARVTRNPAVRDLFNRTSPSVGGNSITNPDNAGNPDLRPEVAWSLDTGLDQRLSEQGHLGLNLFVRQLSDTLATLVTPINGRWLQTRANVGDATVWGLEADVKTGLAWAGLGRDWTLSSNASVLQSRMTSGPSEGNRIPGQARYTASVNVAKPLRSTGGLFGGVTLSLTGPTQLNTSAGITGQDHARAALDVYIGRVQPTWGYWRVGVYNIGNARFNRDRHYADGTSEAWQDRSSMTLTPRVYLSVGTRFCGAFKPC
jgi:outer membrane receptor for ferrienterochelin and colicin